MIKDEKKLFYYPGVVTIGSSVPPSHTSNPLNTLNIFAPPESALQRLQHFPHCHCYTFYQSNPMKLSLHRLVDVLGISVPQKPRLNSTIS